jgi:ribonuclease P protein component
VAPSTAHMAPSPKLRRDADFRHVVQSGQRSSGRLVTMYWVPSEGRSRSGFVVRREIGGAVLRNRARRVLREAWREVAPSMARPVDAVMVARPAIVGAKTGAVAAEIRALLSRDGLIAG